jgi:hypothetical protein
MSDDFWKFRWLFDLEAAGEHPYAAFTVLFIEGFIGAGLLGYFQFTPRNPWLALIYGAMAGLILVFIGSRRISVTGRTDGRPFGIAYRRFFLAMTILIAVGIALASLVLMSPRVAVSALPFAAIAAALFVIERRLNP